MSYILTALKKAQRERDRGTIPKLCDAPAPVSAPRRQQTSRWLGVALAVNGVMVLGTVLWWLGANVGLGQMVEWEAAARATPVQVEPELGPGQRETYGTEQSQSLLSPLVPSTTSHFDSPPSPTTESEMAARPDAPQVTARQQHSASNALLSVAPSPTSNGAQKQEFKTEQPKAVSLPTSGQRLETDLQPATLVRPEKEETNPGSEPVPASVVPQTIRTQATGSTDLPPKREAPKAPIATAERVVSEPDSASFDSIPLLRQLSYSTQTKLPDLSISVHVFAETPTDRFVIIQGKRYQEGDKLREALTLDAITPSGAVLRYQDTKFQIKR